MLTGMTLPSTMPHITSLTEKPLSVNFLSATLSVSRDVTSILSPMRSAPRCVGLTKIYFGGIASAMLKRTVSLTDEMPVASVARARIRYEPGVQTALLVNGGEFALLRGEVGLEFQGLTGVAAVVFSAVAPSRFQAKGGKVEVRLDSPTGPLLGETELIRPTADSGAPPSRLRTTLRPSSGVHDVHLLFRSPEAKGDQFLFGLLTATFEGVPRR